MNCPKIIGISGVARAGKDTFYLLSEKYIYEELGLSCKRYSLADALKDECCEYLMNNFSLDVYSQDPEIKSKFRTFLVWYGDRKREQTNATYFTKILEHQIKQDENVDVALITDIRYGEYPLDEVQWLIDYLNGSLIHISRLDLNGELIQPANDNEKRNDPIMQEFSDYKICWESNIDPTDPHFIEKMYKKYYNNVKKFYSNVVGLKNMKSSLIL